MLRLRLVGALCAGLALVVGAGCALNFKNTRVDVDVKVNEQAIDASLDAAVAKVRGELERRGLQVTVTPEADAVRVVSATKHGDKFTIVLSRAATPSGKEQTRVRVEWDKAADTELWLNLVAAVGSAALSSPR